MIQHARKRNHVVKYSCAWDRRNEFLSELRRKLEKADDAKEYQTKMNKIVGDIRKIFNNEFFFKLTKNC